MYLSPRKFLRNQILLDYLGRWRNQSCQIFFQSVHSGVFGNWSNFAIFSANRRWPLQLLYYRTTVIVRRQLKQSESQWSRESNRWPFGLCANPLTTQPLAHRWWWWSLGNKHYKASVLIGCNYCQLTCTDGDLRMTICFFIILTCILFTVWTTIYKFLRKKLISISVVPWIG